MTLSMAGFALEDLFLKTTAGFMPVGQVSCIMGLCGMMVFGAISIAKGHAPLPRAAFHPVLAIRSVAEVAGRLFYALAVALTPLSSASAILQATPLLVVLAATVLFREKVSAARWGLIVLGFGGVLLIIRPGLDAFDPLSFLALAGMAGFAARDLATRAAPKVLTDNQLGFLGFAMLAVSGVILLGVTGGGVWPGVPAWGFLGATTLFGLMGYAALTRAMRTGEVSVVTPFRYTRLLFALVLGVVVLGETPDALTLCGAVIIVGSGLGLMLWTNRGPRLG